MQKSEHEKTFQPAQQIGMISCKINMKTLL